MKPDKHWFEVWIDGHTHLGDYEAINADEAYNMAYNEHQDEHLDMKEVHVESICNQCGNDPERNLRAPCAECSQGSHLTT